MEKEVNESENTNVETTNVSSLDTQNVEPEKDENTSSVQENVIAETPSATTTKNGKSFFAKFTTIGILPIIAIAIVIILLVGGVTFKVATGTPKAVFTSTINGVYKEVNHAIKDYDKASKKWDVKEKALLFEGDIKANIPGEEMDFKVGYQLGTHPKKEQTLVGGNVFVNEDNIDIKFFVEEDRIYLVSSLLDTPVDITDIASSVFDVDSEEVEEILSLFSSSDYEMDTKDLEYITKTIKNAFIKTLDSKQMKKSSAKYEVDGKSVSATKISYELDSATLKNTIKSMSETLLEDDKFLDKLSDLVINNPAVDMYVKNSDEEAPSKSDIKSSIKDGLKEIKSSASDIDLDEEIIINLYIKGLTNKVVGFSIEVDEKEYISYYTNGKNAEFILDNHVKEDSHYSSKVKLVITLTQNKKEQELLVKYNGEKIVEATIRSLEEEKIDLDFKVGSKEDVVKGSIYFTKKEKKEEINGEFKVSFDIEEEKVSLEGTYSFKTLDNLEDFSKDAINVDEIDYDTIQENIEKSIKSEDLAQEISDLVREVEKKSLNLNSYGMKEITEKEAIELLQNKKTTILYVGDTYYNSYYDKESYELFYNLRSLQNTYGFYSYYLDDYDATTKFFDAVGEIPYSCYLDTEKNVTENDKTDVSPEEPTENVGTTEPIDLCKQVPVIYLIKDGKVVKGLRTGISSEELKKEFESLGIK